MAQIPSACLAGAFYGVSSIVDGSLWVAAIMHAVHNMFSIVLFQSRDVVAFDLIECIPLLWGFWLYSILVQRGLDDLEMPDSCRSLRLSKRHPHNAIARCS